MKPARRRRGEQRFGNYILMRRDNQTQRLISVNGMFEYSSLEDAVEDAERRQEKSKKTTFEIWQCAAQSPEFARTQLMEMKAYYLNIQSQDPAK